MNGLWLLIFGKSIYIYIYIYFVIWRRITGILDNVHLVIIGLCQQKKILKICEVFMASKIEHFQWHN
jgi:hypothetical protein